MRRAAALVIVFALGAAIGTGVMRLRYGRSGGAERRSARDLASALSAPPASVGVPETPLVAAAARIERSVVNIDTLQPGQRGYDIWGMPIYETVQGKASGVVISVDGHILTNSHVVENASIIRVRLPDGRHVDGRVLADDRDADLALVKIDGVDLTPAELGDSDKVKVGEYVVAVGNPRGIGTTVTHGIISAVHKRDLLIEEGHVLHGALQTDAAINPGNSGGALANMQGQVIGINTAISSPIPASVGLGFAIPVNTARRVLKELLSHRSLGAEDPGKPFMGILFGVVPPDIATRLGLRPGVGAMVVHVTPLTGAADAGVIPGSIVVAADGHAVTRPSDLTDAVRRHRVGETIRLRLLLDDGNGRDTAIRLGRRPSGT